ncbi:MAG: hydantoinase/oxoprolinase family protein [Hyphomicrobiales bacterium]|nr:hydantoinase/oxoprolinase family protein [Hyphomicrobiales bacterium]
MAELPTGKRYLIGVDTGGTYTDAAVIDAASNDVVASAKALTTRGDLSIGVSQAIANALAAMPSTIAVKDINLVSVSTTLATNAVVEGHGSTVGVLLIGFDAKMVEKSGIAGAFAGMPVARIAGGHNHNGDEASPLDVAALEAELEQWGSKVDAVAIAAQFAVRNPAHEHAARDLVIEKTAKPVTVSSELSSALDAPRRALTAVLNTRLISRISNLIEAVRTSMAEAGIKAPLMIVKGDGTLALAETVAMRPIETILSGPAASLVGAAALSGLKDFIMSDMGGTTTDLGVLADGRPRVSEIGAEVGGWRTMVKAIDVTTIGLGGDSEVMLSMNGQLSVGPRRVVPISLIAAQYPEVAVRLERELADANLPVPGRFVMLPMGAGGTGLDVAGLSQREQDALAVVTERPQPMAELAGSSSRQRTVQSLQRKGFVQIAGFTPSDAGHVLGLQDNWSRPAALLAARIAARQRGALPTDDGAAEAFCREVWSETVRLTGRVILATAFGDGGSAQDAGGLADAVCRGDGGIGLAKVSISPSVPIVAVGGPVKVFYPETGRRLGADMRFPDYCEVANAVGAATSVIARSVSVEVSGDGSGQFRVHDAGGTQLFAQGAEALRYADARARETARAQVLEMGGVEPDIQVTVDKRLLPDAVDDNGLLYAEIRAEAVARPQI